MKVFTPAFRPLPNPSAYASSICSTLSAGRIWSANARERIAPAKPSTPGSTNSAIASAKKRPWRRSVRGKSAATSSHTARIR